MVTLIVEFNDDGRRREVSVRLICTMRERFWNATQATSMACVVRRRVFLWCKWNQQGSDMVYRTYTYGGACTKALSTV